MDYVTLDYKEGVNEESYEHMNSIIQAIPLEETIYYKRAAAKIPEINIKKSFHIQRDDLSFWVMMLTDRIKCAKEWIVQSDNYELHESDLSLFSELLSELSVMKPSLGPRKHYKMTLSLYKIHGVLGALEIQSHESMYLGKKKDYNLSCKYTKQLQEVMVSYRSVLKRIDDVLLGSPWK